MIKNRNTLAQYVCVHANTRRKHQNFVAELLAVPLKHKQIFNFCNHFGSISKNNGDIM